MEITLEPVTATTMSDYIAVGTKSYKEHYLHLWESENPTPYIEKSFTKDVVKTELANANMVHFLVKAEHTTIGIVKLVIDCPLDELPANDLVLIEKIYLLREFSGKGNGKKALQLIEAYAKGLRKKMIWLDTMKKANAINFYIKNGFQIKRESELTLKGVKPSEKAIWILTKSI
ncbi:GNAT family N-acetyltransferase [Flagellimonas sp. 389]|uniref:GNAT family N-acetyltransferase n=1 Tax=Flagellimonas sp. 389 TaxID=2835862 RepID=UPI001BD607A1|nr:GNAT family N-acetyltransferase [Flagellimonas sp. 389]MBS9461603.1 GNAT family N-acetyltransferase [Flagellimonas sp. 389]